MEKNKIYLGDAIKLIEELDEKPQLIIMSPPDLSETTYNLKEYKQFIKTIYEKCAGKLADDGTIISITTDRKMDGIIYTKHIDIINSVPNMKLFNYKIWCKSMKTNLFILNYAHMLCFRKDKNINNKLAEFMPDVWDIPLDKVEGYKNKDSFPTELVRRLVLNFTNEGALVLDPFMGTGKTAIVCLAEKRKFIGFELNKEYFELASEAIWKN